MQSCTSKVRVIEATIGGKRVVVIDTPGIDDSRAGVKEADILAGIAHLLENMYVRICAPPHRGILS